jgi:serine/threonine-protein kinase
VAFSRLPPESARDPEFVALFLDEARMASRVRLPHVVQTIEVIVENRSIALVMEYVHGEPLSRVLRTLNGRGERAPVGVSVGICAGMLNGLHAAHEAKDERGQALGIIHRDVSPQNVIVGTDGIARVVDFGVAKAAGRLQTTREGRLKGKIAYMCPEQLLAAPADRRFDVYAAAVVLWEALTGKRLFTGDLEAIVLASVLNERVLPPSEHNPDVPPALDEIVLRGLRRDPSERYATARDMANALEAGGFAMSATAIGEWLEAAAGDTLKERAARVTAIETSFDADVVSGARDIVTHITGGRAPEMAPRRGSEEETLKGELTTGGSASVTHAKAVGVGRSRARTLMLFGVAAALACATVVFAFSRRKPVVETQHELRADPPMTAMVSVAPPIPSVTASSEPIAPTPSAVKAAPVATVKRPPAAASSSTPSVASSTATLPRDCDPPFVRDADGHKVYKLNCL